MFGTHFYNEHVRKYTGAFGSLFNNINIVRRGPNDTGTNIQKVPISYAPKRKYLERIRQDTKNELNQNRFIALTLPRMSFEMVGMNYDASRQLPKTNYCTFPGADKSNKKKVYTKTPYVIQFQLNVYGKHQDDCLQVIEQIMPYFTPQYTLSIRPFADYPSIVDDVPLTLQGISFTDDFEGTMEQRRTIIYSLDFEMKTDVYGPLVDSPIIEQADIRFFLPDSDGDSDFSYSTDWARYSTFSVTTDPTPVSPDSDYSFVETITLRVDSS